MRLYILFEWNYRHVEIDTQVWHSILCPISLEVKVKKKKK